MSQYPVQPPSITLKQLDEPPFEVDGEFFDRFTFVAPELGREGWSTSYEYPGPRFWTRREYRVSRKARVHGVECLEVQCHAYDAEGNLAWENVAYGKVDRGHVRRYGFLYGDEKSVWITTWKDNDFDAEWGYDPGNPTRMADVGRWQWLDDQHFTDKDLTPAPSGINPNGAGLWEVRLGEVVHRCLRVLEPDDTPEGIMAEAFVDRQGHVVLARRYNGTRWSYGSKRTLVDGEPREWAELLPDAPRLYYDDICFVLWDFSIPDVALEPSSSNEVQVRLPNSG
jgi:hypothetical protein